MKYYDIYECSLGNLGIAEENGRITDLWFADQEDKWPQVEVQEETALLARAKIQLDEYFEGERKQFELPLNPSGTEFQCKVWRALEEIPYGETRSYKEIAEAVGSPKGFRAVGLANNKNPIAIIIPCHRVVGADKSLVGYGGGLDLKVALLALEAWKK